MTPQSKLKRFLRWLRHPHSSQSAAVEDTLDNGGSHVPLRRSCTQGVIIPSEKTSGNIDSLSKSYDSASSVAGRASLPPMSTRLHPLSSYKEAISCPTDCPCHCHDPRPHADQSYLTLCRCHLSGYESYRKAVYGGRGLLKKPSSQKRKSMIDSKKLFGSTDTLESVNSCDTLKVSSDGVSSSEKSTCGSSDTKRQHSTTSLTRQRVSPSLTGQRVSPSTEFRDRQIILTQVEVVRVVCRTQSNSL